MPPGELPDASPPGPTPDDTEGADLGRRRFFRQLAGDLIQTAATVAGAAGAIQRTTAEAAAVIMDPDGAPARLGMSVPSKVGIGAMGFRTAFRWDGDVLHVVDQRRLPGELVDLDIRSASDAVQAIRELAVRGAPAIGQVAAIALALSANRLRATRPYARRASIRGAAAGLARSRPTAVNLQWAVDRMLARLDAVGDLNEDGQAVADALRAEAEAIVFEATDDHGRLARFGADAMPDPGDRPLRILTHCNTGPLACGQFGTALGIVQVLHHDERPVHVWVDETRPVLQGARLTAWELGQAGVPHAVLPDVAAASLLSAGRVDVVLVGADRIAANGDTANKVGTYPLAVLAARHGVPFYVCAPLTSFDRMLPDGSTIPIEERPATEVTRLAGQSIAPAGSEAFNPAFDVTPHDLITGIVTDEGVLRPPFDREIAEAFARNRERRAHPPAHAAFVADRTVAEQVADDAPGVPRAGA